MFGPEFILIVCGVSDMSCGVSDIVKQYAWHCLDCCQQQLASVHFGLAPDPNPPQMNMQIYYCTFCEGLNAVVTSSGAGHQ
jgi:hypothetical protein